ncbi:hypothetical protein UFOVP257_210 [uncultured Caudovirales phage]|uniref:Uncharacterized protein n=1 Tax=uncultured Caudovirales phage TaxID=2100421 RepID=A0A6J5LJG2_9CAUD|nr:hypothetical protein UFOVP257_210 [uncultured Caudovirales phage]
MGLDMYLKAKKYLSQFDEKDESKIESINDMFFPSNLTHKDDDFSRSISIKEVAAEVAYWRKANAIHGWFVENCQDGVDECQESYVGHEKLKELLSIVTKVLDNNELADTLLPPQQGFFFGSDKIDKWYLDDLQFTKERLTQLLEEPSLQGWDFYYQASW